MSHDKLSKNGKHFCLDNLIVLRNGVVWDDDDFKMLGLDPHCLSLHVAPVMRSKKELPASFESGSRIGKRLTQVFMVMLYWKEDPEEI